MNFDFGEVLSRAWQITWKHKVLWIISALPFLLTLFIAPVWFVFVQNLNPNKLSELFESQKFIAVAPLFFLGFFVLNILLQVASRSSATLGIYRSDAGLQPITLVDLLDSGLQYFWRIFGVGFLIIASVVVLFVIFSVLDSVLSILTMGLSTLCFQPLFFLMFPLSLLVGTLIEQAEAAVVIDEMSVLDALRRSYGLVGAHIWQYILITIVIYIGMNILISLVVFPFMIPMFLFAARNEAGMDFSKMVRLQAISAVVLFPLITLVQGVALTYMKSAMMVVYLRFTRAFHQSGLVQEATA